MQRILIAALFAMVLFFIGLAPADNSDNVVYELRTYTTNEGKLDELHKRFREHTLQLFEKHGMKNIAYWIPLDQPNTLIYILTHKNQDAAKDSWKAFVNDPEWKAVYQASIENGKLVAKIESVFMTATDYSPMN